MHELRSILRQRFGLVDFRPGQAEAIQNLLAGKHVLVVMPTNAGKSLIYQLAALEMPGTTIVISPLIALMKDQVDALARRGIAATFINSSVDGTEQSRRLRKVTAGEVKILYVAPERLRSEAFVRTLGNISISLLAVDEAHCISEWGHDFRPDYLQIGPRRHLMKNPPTVALTATATPKVQGDITKQLGLQAVTRIITGFNRPNLALRVQYLRNEEAKYDALRNFLQSAPQLLGLDKRMKPAGIIYVGTTRDAELLSEFVRGVCKVEALFYHGRMESAARSEVQEAFMSGDLPVVVATNAFGMGIDRPDIRFVLHFAMPGTLEAYYQEAGRAGRDGLGAQCVLLYCPEDRRLQEWFIENDAPTLNETLALLESIRRIADRGALRTRAEDLSNASGLHEVKLKVALAQLEMSGGIERLGDEGPLMCLRLGRLDRKLLLACDRETQERRRRKREELSKMTGYSEANECRRGIILRHFGDSTETSAEPCCDNCLARRPATPTRAAARTGQLSETDRIPLAVLDAVRCLNREVGRGKLAQLLKGSRAADMVRFGYDRAKYYGRLRDLRLADTEDLIDQLTKDGYLKRIGGELPVLRLTPQGEISLRERTSIPFNLPGRRAVRTGAPGAAAEQTLEMTRQLLALGLTPQQIATERDLTEGTIYSHLAKLTAQGTVQLDDFLPRPLQEQIRAAAARVGSAEYLSPVKALLPETITYDQIRCVCAALPGTAADGMRGRVEPAGKRATAAPGRLPESPLCPGDDAVFAALKAWRRETAFALNRPAFCVFHDSVLRELATGRPGNVDAIIRIKGIGPHKGQSYGQQIIDIIGRAEAQVAASLRRAEEICPETSAQALTSSETFVMPEPVKDFLSSAHPRPLAGPWNSGWALDFNSRFSGSTWVRTEVGDLAFRYKYRGEREIAAQLTHRFAALFEKHREMKDMDVLIPVPPSSPREFDPVSVLCHALGERLALPVLLDCLVKTRRTAPQKNFATLAQKRANVSGAFAVPQDKIPILRGKRVLLLDDLFDSGATLREATRVLAREGAASVSVATITKTIHSEG